MSPLEFLGLTSLYLAAGVALWVMFRMEHRRRVREQAKRWLDEQVREMHRWNHELSWRDRQQRWMRRIQG